MILLGAAFFPHMQVLEKISGTFGYKNIEDFMNTHLDYLVLEWLNCGYSLSIFPYVLLNYASLKEFYRYASKLYLLLFFSYIGLRILSLWFLQTFVYLCGKSWTYIVLYSLIFLKVILIL